MPMVSLRRYHSIVLFAHSNHCDRAVGGRVDQLNYDKEYARKVNVEMTNNAAQAMSVYLAPHLPVGKAFHFVYCSGSYAEWDQNKTLLFLGDSRRFKGESEKQLCELADNQVSKDKFKVWIVRPLGLLDESSPLMKKWTVGKLGFGTETAQLGRAMVQIALDGADQRILENERIQDF